MINNNFINLFDGIGGLKELSRKIPPILIISIKYENGEDKIYPSIEEDRVRMIFYDYLDTKPIFLGTEKQIGIKNMRVYKTKGNFYSFLKELVPRRQEKCFEWKDFTYELCPDLVDDVSDKWKHMHDGSANKKKILSEIYHLIMSFFSIIG